jgi:hypothetical protein
MNLTRNLGASPPAGRVRRAQTVPATRVQAPSSSSSSSHKLPCRHGDRGGPGPTRRPQDTVRFSAATIMMMSLTDFRSRRPRALQCHGSQSNPSQAAGTTGRLDDHDLSRRRRDTGTLIMTQIRVTGIAAAGPEPQYSVYLASSESPSRSRLSRTRTRNSHRGATAAEAVTAVTVPATQSDPAPDSESESGGLRLCRHESLTGHALQLGVAGATLANLKLSHGLPHGLLV